MSAARTNPIESVEAPFSRARSHALAAEVALSSIEMIRKRHSDVEDMIEAQGREWARLMLDEHMALRAALEKRVKVSDAEGVERSSARASERQLTTVVGKVTVPRTAYQEPGREDLHPMDGVLNLPREQFSHGIRRMVAKEAARASFDEVVAMVRDYTGSVIAKRQVEQLAVRAAQDFEPFYAQRPAPHDPSSELLVLSTDGKGIVMRHEDLRESTRIAAEKKVNKLETRLTPGEKSNRKRMAQVASVYSVAPWVRSASDVLHEVRPDDVAKRRPAPHDKRVWASVEQSRARARVRVEGGAGALRRQQREGREVGGRAAPRAAQRSQRRSGGAFDSLVGRPEQARCIGARRDRERVRLHRGPHANEAHELRRRLARRAPHRDRGHRRRVPFFSRGVNLQAIDLGGKLLVVWSAGDNGGVRMRVGTPDQLATAPETILLDDHVRDGAYRDESMLVGFELLPFAKSAVLLLGTVEGVYAFLVETDGKLSPLPTRLK